MTSVMRFEGCKEDERKEAASDGSISIQEMGKPGIRGEGAGLPTDSWIGSEPAVDSV
jgi:hypothetical protein